MNNKCYIGKTKNENIEKYIQDHFKIAIQNKYKKRKYLYCAIRKYGQENFKWEILGYCDNETNLNFLEKAFIKKYNSFGENGYNMTEGGDGGNVYSGLSKERKQECNKKRNESNNGKLKGKTYEEIYGKEKAKQIS